MQPLTYKQQLFCVFNISFAFLLMFIAYSPLENIITKIYRDMGYEYFGQVSIAIVYLCFGFSTALSSTIIKLLGYKMVFIAGAICYTLFDASGLIVSYVISSKIMAWLTVIFSCSLCGLSAGCIWVAQGAYIGNISSLQYRDQMFGIFWGIRNISGIIGYVISTYFLSHYGSDMYFKVLIPISALSILIFYILPQTDISKIDATAERQSEIIGLAKIKHYFSLLSIHYCSVTGVIVGVVSTFLYKVVISCIEHEANESSSQIVRKQNYLVGIFFLICACAQCIGGFTIKKVAQYSSCYEMSFYGLLMCDTAVLLTFLSYVTRNYSICCVCSIVWGLSYTFNRSICNSLISIAFSNNLDYFGISYMISSFTVITTIFTIMVVKQLSLYFVLLLLMVVFLWLTKYSFRIYCNNGTSCYKAMQVEVQMNNISKK